MRRHTLKENLISAALGVVIALLLGVRLRPVYLAEQQERKEIEAEVIAEWKARDAEIEAQKKAELEAEDRDIVGTAAPAKNQKPEEVILTEAETLNIDDLEPKPVITEPVIDETELWHLAALIHAEVGCESEKSKYLCGAVVLNRVSSPYFANTIEEVIHEKGQYACTWDGGYERALKEYDEVSYQVALDLLTNGIPDWIPDTVVWQAEFKQGDGVFMKVDNTYYCYTNGVQD